MDKVKFEMKGYEQLVYYEMLQLQHILVVSNLRETTHVHFINGTTSIKIADFPKRSDLATYAEKHQILAVYNQKEQKIGFYLARKRNNVISNFDISGENDAIELKGETWNNTANFHIKHMKLDDSTKRLVIVDNSNTLRIYDLINRSWYCNAGEDRDSLPLKVNVRNCLITQDGAFLLVLSNENENENDKNAENEQELKNGEIETLSTTTDNCEGDGETSVVTIANVVESTSIVITVVLLDDLDILKQISLAHAKEFSTNNIDKICLKYVRMKNDLGNESRASIAVLDNNGKDLYVQLLDVSVSSSKLQFRIKTNDNSNNDKSNKHRKYTKLDYLTFMMDKFGSKAVFYQNNIKDLLEFNTCLLIDNKTLSPNEEMANKEMKLCKKVCKKSCDIVKDECKKDFGLLQWNNEAIAIDFDSEKNYLNFDYLINQCKLKQNGCLLSKFIVNVIIQFPIQIGHTQGGRFVIMYNGEDNQSEYLQGCNTASEWRDKISFGGYDAIISNWNGPIRVVSSMGKQSTGKSYFLNHLFGSKFETSGARCTDGAWMTVRICKGIKNIQQANNQYDKPENDKDGNDEIDILYIIMDFEGLGTYERTEQEDTTLAVFNSSISNCTIFRSENRLGPELTRMFQRFQNGVSQLGGDKSLFQGCLLMTIKDIPPSDRESVKNEFTSKFQQFVAETDKTNEQKDESNSFLLHMYKQEPNLVIKPYPPLSSDKFFPQMIKFKNKYIDKSKIVHDKGGTIFLQHMKLLMAKLAMSDFSDLAGQMAQTRIDSLQVDIEASVLYGSLKMTTEDDMGVDEENTFALGASSSSYFSSVNERLSAIRIKVPDEKQLFVIETKEKINVRNYVIVDEWVRDNMNSSNKYIKLIAKQIQNKVIDDGNDSKEEQQDNNNKNLKEEYLNLLNFVKDEGLLLDEISINEHLFSIFEHMAPQLKRKHGNGLNMSFHGFEAFLSMLFIRRRDRIMKWIRCNTDRFIEKEEKQIVNKFIDQSNHLLSKLSTKLQLCGNECMSDGCKFLCLLPKDHASIKSATAGPGFSSDLTDHDCFGSHKCEEMCDYCQDCKEKIDSSLLLQSCHYAAGHDGKHDCKISTMKNHSCDHQCSLTNKSGKQYLNCKGTCSKTYNHFDENKNDECVCDAKHLCGEPCGASLCTRQCIIPYNKAHKVHDCGKRECLHKCEVKCGDPMNKDSEPIDCGEPCKCENHFHDSAIQNKTLKQNEANFHCCMKEHDCGEKCGESGNCGVKNFKSSTTVVREYISKSGRKIQYAAWTTTANAYKKSCNHKIPVGEKSHDGKHMCNSNKHTCDVKCPQCLYYCEEEYGHNKNNSKSLHSIQNHGNMVNTIFMSDESKFQVNHEKLNEMNKGGKDDNKDEEKSNSNVNLLRVYQRNDKGTAEMCHNFCVTQGRGHVHLISCKEWEKSDKTEAVDGQKCEQRYTYDGKIYGRHAPPDKYGTNGDDLDEIMHAEYWSKYLKFKDPVIYNKQRKPFGKCNHFCGAPGHENDKEKSYCVKDLWHEKVKEKERSEHQTLNQGHLFNCKHAEPHIVFMLDDSGSMSTGDCKPSLTELTTYRTNVYNLLYVDSLLGRTTLNNRMGSVLEALIKFLVARQSQGYNDKFTVMFHGKTTITLCERENLASLDGSTEDKRIVNYIKQKCFNQIRWGGTNFGEAMFEAQQLIEKYKEDNFVIIFLTDGDCDDLYAKHDKSLTASERVKYLKETYKKFSFCAIQFGPDEISPALQKMVKAAGRNQVETAKIPSKLQQIFSNAVKKETDIVLKYNNNNA